VLNSECQTSNVHGVYVKRQPIPVDMKKSNLKAEIQKALDSTYMHLNAGSCRYIRNLKSTS
jgi:hypothetical protein